MRRAVCTIATICWVSALAMCGGKPFILDSTEGPGGIAPDDAMEPADGASPVGAPDSGLDDRSEPGDSSESRDASDDRAKDDAGSIDDGGLRDGDQESDGGLRDADDDGSLHDAGDAGGLHDASSDHDADSVHDGTVASG